MQSKSHHPHDVQMPGLPQLSAPRSRPFVLLPAAMQRGVTCNGTVSTHQASEVGVTGGAIAIAAACKTQV